MITKQQKALDRIRTMTGDLSSMYADVVKATDAGHKITGILFERLKTIGIEAGAANDTVKKGDKVYARHDIDMHGTGGPFIARGTEMRVFIARRGGEELWVEIADVGRRRLAADLVTKVFPW